jgi:hypothetical protein
MLTDLILPLKDTDGKLDLKGRFNNLLHTGDPSH